METETNAATSCYDYWMKELDIEQNLRKEWRDRGAKVIKRYKDEEEHEGSRFNILWSNTKVLHAATLSSRPKPDVSRRFKDPNEVSRQVSEVIERALSYSLDVYDFDSHASMSVLDYLLSGLGQIRVRYIPYYEKGEPPVIPLMTEEVAMDAMGMDSEEMDGETKDVNASVTLKYLNGEEEVPAEKVQFTENQTPYMLGEPEDEVVYEEVACEIVPWDKFRWQPSTSWEMCDWVAFEHYLTKKEVEEQFGEELAAQVPYAYTAEGKATQKEDDQKNRALVFEIYDKKEREVIVLAKGLKEPLDKQEDPLNLQGFFPCPKPMLTNTTSTSDIPTPDFILYQDQAIELDMVTRRIDALTKHIKWRGFYDGSFKSFEAITTLDDGDFEPVADYSERFPNGRSLDQALLFMPLQELMGVLNSLYQSREAIKQTIYEITGISDIVRGATKATETLGAQQLKQQNAGLRLTEKTNEVNRFIRDIFRLKAEIIAEHFSPDTLSMMTGVEVTPEMMQMMKSDLLRSYAIDVESDSTVAIDQNQEQQNVVELLGAVTQFMTAAGPLTQAGIPPELIKEMLLFAIRRFKNGRQLEQVIEKYGQTQPAQMPGMPQGMPPQMPQEAMNAGNGPTPINSPMGGTSPQLPIQ